MRRTMLCLISASLMLPTLAHSTDRTPASPSILITLGTMGGPVASPVRSQPANVLLSGQNAYLVDAGDGAVEQLAKAGVRLESVRAIFLTHLHFDHTGGLAALLGLRYQTSVPGSITIYGPPGTRQMIAGLTQSMMPAAEAGYGVTGAKWVRPESTVTVIELNGGDKVSVEGLSVTTAQNTHYDFKPGSPQDKRFKSLSLRFDLPDRSIVFTGDTGPSSAVEALARGADLLVSEMIDVEGTLANIRRNDPNLSVQALSGIRYHLTAHHLTPEQVGALAASAGVKRLVVSHFSGGTANSAAFGSYLAAIRTHFAGPVSLANDLDRF